MIRSMTGYGEAVRAAPGGELRVEVRTVNHRYFNPSIRLPSSAARLEGEVRERLRGSFSRGHVACTIRIGASESESAPIVVDHERVSAYLEAYRELGRRHGVEGSPDLALLARHSDIFRRASDDDLPEVDAGLLHECLDEAVRANVAMREAEGERLAADLQQRMAAIEAALSRISETAPRRLERERDRIATAVRELAGSELRLDTGRLEQEVVMAAERWDVAEELVRFVAHLEAARGFLAGEGEAVGKRFSFLVQEMHREANTIGSKANDAGISHEVVAIKEELERLREQAENVE